MPVTKSAIKKNRQDKKREQLRNLFERSVRSALKSAQRDKTFDTMKKAFSLIDKAVKKNIYHTNKAGRLKSSLSKLLPKIEAKLKTAKVVATKKVVTTKKAPKARTATAS